MMDTLKKMDKKFLITVGCLIAFPLLIIIILMILRGCSGGMSYEKYQSNMVSEAKKYFKYHDLLPSVEGKEQIVTLDDLVVDGFKSPEKALKDNTCTGSVTVKKNNKYYLYIPYLECKDYTTKYISDKLTKNIVTKESGLYKIGNEYVYKGNKVDNYVKFFDTLYRIVKIDDNGNIWMIKNDRQDDQISWDTKYNVEADDSVGINDYYNSSIYDQLWKDYNKNDKFMSDDVRTHMVAHNVCLDKKKMDDKSIEKNTCSDVLEGQYISLPTLYDYALATYDENCKQIGDGACSNYNYLEDTITSTWTNNASADDTFSVYYMASSYVDAQQAYNYKGYYWIITISGNELYNGGNGTLEKPYIIQ